MMTSLSLRSMDAESEYDCVLTCTETADCVAINYNYPSRLCELGTADQELKEGTFRLNQDVVHYSTVFCHYTPVPMESESDGSSGDGPSGFGAAEA